MIKKSLSFVLATFLALGGILVHPTLDVSANPMYPVSPSSSSNVNQTPVADQAVGFKDIYRGYIFYEEIEFLSSKQIIKGFPDGVFRPEIPITRAQAAIMFGRALELNIEPRDTKFSDVTAKVSGAGYIASVVEKGIINGYPDNTYHPYEPVTRAQMAIFLDSAFDLINPNPANTFKDISPNMIAYQSILNVYRSGIVNGFPDGTFYPDNSVTRGEFSAYLARAIEPSFRGAPSLEVESISDWKKGTPIIDVDIDKGWIINFNDKVDERSLYNNIYVVRESDKQSHFVFPIVDFNDPKSVRLLLGSLYDFDETYTLYITKDVKSKFGNPLGDSITLKFHTRKLEYNLQESIVLDGVKFYIQLDQSDEKVFINVTATNISSENIPYVGFNGCDPGISTALFTDSGDGEFKEGSKWSGMLVCTQMIEEHIIKPGASIKVSNLLYTLTQLNNGQSYVKVVFQKGSLDSPKPIVVSIPLQEIID
jgi:hypothetical protein